ncbi:MAG TPA: diacylglycerol kinase family protein [Sphingomicrobium sp.]|nr:diacylglycerol kinase family protein [Sphingomicrobium sp.]
MALINRQGGAASRDPDIRATVAEALDQAGIGAVIEVIGGSEFAERCRALAQRGDPIVIVGGGDGTMAAAASALAGTKTALALLPLGTLNHFARDLGIPVELDEAAAVIANGEVRDVDIGEMNGRVFINNSAIGLYPLMVIDRELQRSRLGRSKKLAMVLASIRTLARFGHRRLTLTVNDERQGRVETPLLFVGNNDYRIDIGAPGRRESLDDGRLCVLVMRKKTRRGLIAASLRALFDRSRPDDLVRIDDVEKLRVDSHRSRLAVSLDGEVAHPEPPLDYRIRPGALRVVLPPR